MESPLSEITRRDADATAPDRIPAISLDRFCWLTAAALCEQDHQNALATARARATALACIGESFDAHVWQRIASAVAALMQPIGVRH
jgi:hypothetical protein